jgi:hypothetical protein
VAGLGANEGRLKSLIVEETREASEELSSLVRVSRRLPWFAGDVGLHTQVPQGGRIPVKIVPGIRSRDGIAPSGPCPVIVQHSEGTGFSTVQQQEDFWALWVVQAETSVTPQSIPTIAARAIHGSLR